MIPKAFCPVLAALSLFHATTSFAQPSFILGSTFTGEPVVGGFLMTADINNDGRPDVFATRGTALNRGDGTMNNVVPVGSEFHDRQGAAADLNGDGWIDLAFPVVAPSSIQLLTNNSGILAPAPLFTLEKPFPGAVSAGDVNGDSSPDLVIAHRQHLGPLAVVTNNGSGNFAQMIAITNGIFGPVWIRLADINSDQQADLICGDLTSSVIVYTNAFGTNFILSCTVSNLIGTGPLRIRSVGDVADVNGDGKPDLLCPSFSTNAEPFLNFLKIATNAGNGIFLPASTTVLGPLATNQARGSIVIAAEFNLDGKVDCVFQAEPDDRFVVATNRGDGIFAVARTMVTGSDRLGIAVADFNADGKFDIVSGSSAGLLQVYLNSTATSAPEVQIALSGSQSNVVYWPGLPGQFDLQSTTNVGSTNWQNVADGIPVTGMMLSNSSPQLFFRLKAR